jgi:hypothetical protein
VSQKSQDPFCHLFLTVFEKISSTGMHQKRNSLSVFISSFFRKTADNNRFAIAKQPLSSGFCVLITTSPFHIAVSSFCGCRSQNPVGHLTHGVYGYLIPVSPTGRRFTIIINTRLEHIITIKIRASVLYKVET